TSALVDAAEELFKLEESAPSAHAAGVPEATTSALVQEARSAAEAVWRCAERVEAVAAQEFMSERVEQALQREAEKLERLIQATRQAREGLAELTLSK